MAGRRLASKLVPPLSAIPIVSSQRLIRLSRRVAFERLMKNISIALLILASTSAFAEIAVRVIVDRGEDIGQNFGSLFEGHSEDGAFVIGAGFSGAYNTDYRHDRHTVHFFLRPTGESPALTATTLPRPGLMAGNYLYNFDGKVYATAPQGRVWNDRNQTWNPSPTQDRVATRVGNHLLSFDSGSVLLDAKTVLPAAKEGRYRGFYYAQGFLVFYHVYRPGEANYRHHSNDSQGYSKLYACPWKPGTGTVNLDQATVKTLPIVGEFPYAYGQLDHQTVSCSNIGGVYALRNGQWRTLVEGSMDYSYQVYAGFTYYDRLLLGQYPSGELFAFDGESVERLKGWPPVMTGVSQKAREAQTIVLYGGELYVGVWPWGEVWRYHRDLDKWNLARRMFTHPSITNQSIHPYELECQALGVVANLWGQRVTSMVPLNDSLLIATSAKTPIPWDPKFDFVGKNAWKEYGSVTRVRASGHLSVPVEWTDGPTELRFMINEDTMRVEQDGVPIESSIFHGSEIDIKGVRNINWGQGAYGVFSGTRLEGSTISH